MKLSEASALKARCVSVVFHGRIGRDGEFRQCPGTSQFELHWSAGVDAVPTVNMFSFLGK